jgi:hypothetical protein
VIWVPCSRVMRTLATVITVWTLIAAACPLLALVASMHPPVRAVREFARMCAVFVHVAMPRAGVCLGGVSVFG